MSRAGRMIERVGVVSKWKGYPIHRIMVSHILPHSLLYFSRPHSNSPPKQTNPPAPLPATSTSNNQTTPLPSPDVDDLPADVSTQELKRRIDRFHGGDAAAIPLIFEAILARKLNGNHDNTDDELMEEFRSNRSSSDDDFSGSDDDLSDESDDNLSD